MFDLIVRNGFVVDGTGHPGMRMDAAVRDGRIAAVGLSLPARWYATPIAPSAANNGLAGHHSMKIEV